MFRSILVEVGDFLTLLGLMQWRYRHRLVIFVFARATKKLLNLRLLDGMVLPFRAVIAYAAIDMPSGLRFLIEIAQRHVYSNFVTSQDAGIEILYDVGANSGFLSLTRCLENRQLQAVCFEPHPKTFSILKRNIGLNALTDRVTPVNVAVDRSSGILHLNIAEGDSMAGVTRNFLGQGTPSEIAIPAVSLDEYAQQHGLWPDAIKIDVEGHEEQVLLGAKQVLGRAKLLVMEVHSEELKARCTSILKWGGYHVAENGSLLFCQRHHRG
ncbi:MAG TPA: FkbM family methyltransferase [Verrucomicrobiae bacterium]|nr:FkbM family methyltransferase [Verrucomicrobiae bacterium]